MNPVSAIVVFLIIWWLVLFMVLPFGIQREDAPLPGNDPGAPVNPRMWTKIGVTTVITAIVFGITLWVVLSGLVSFRGLTFDGV